MVPNWILIAQLEEKISMINQVITFKSVKTKSTECAITVTDGHVQKKVAHRDIAKTEKSHIFVLFENEASYEFFFFFAHKCFKSCYRYFV